MPAGDAGNILVSIRQDVEAGIDHLQLDEYDAAAALVRRVDITPSHGTTLTNDGVGKPVRIGSNVYVLVSTIWDPEGFFSDLAVVADDDTVTFQSAPLFNPMNPGSSGSMLAQADTGGGSSDDLALIATDSSTIQSWNTSTPDSADAEVPVLMGSDPDVVYFGHLTFPDAQRIVRWRISTTSEINHVEAPNASDYQISGGDLTPSGCLLVAVYRYFNPANGDGNPDFVVISYDADDVISTTWTALADWDEFNFPPGFGELSDDGTLFWFATTDISVNPPVYTLHSLDMATGTVTDGATGNGLASWVSVPKAFCTEVPPPPITAPRVFAYASG